MTITIGVDYENFIISSELLDAWGENDTPATLYVYEACSDTAVEIEMSEDVETGSYDMLIDAALLGQSGTAIADGIYRLELVSTGDDIITEKYCLFIDNELKCNIVEYLADNLTSNIYHLYMVLANAETCVDCNCSNLCTIYDEIIRLIDTQTDGCTTCS